MHLILMAIVFWFTTIRFNRMQFSFNSIIYFENLIVESKKHFLVVHFMYYYYRLVVPGGTRVLPLRYQYLVPVLVAARP